MSEIIASEDPRAVERTVEVLSSGGVVVLPTDTVYGLAAAATDVTATGALFGYKGRTADVPIAVLCASVDQAIDLTSSLSKPARALMNAHWPGALTLVLHRHPDLGWELGEPRDTIGVRCPDHEFVRSVASAVGPLATTSANRHGVPTPDTAREAAAGLAGAVDLVVDGGRLRGTPSTVVDATGPVLRVLRHGAVEVAIG